MRRSGKIIIIAIIIIIDLDLSIGLEMFGDSMSGGLVVIGVAQSLAIGYFMLNEDGGRNG